MWCRSIFGTVLLLSRLQTKDDACLLGKLRDAAEVFDQRSELDIVRHVRQCATQNKKVA